MLSFKNKKVTIMGLGLHGGGLAVTSFLAKNGAILTVTDLKTRKQLQPSIEKLKAFKIKYVLGKHRLQDFRQADLVIQNPDVRRNSKFLIEAKKNKIPIETDLSLFFKLCPTQNIIGITGTKGKSTTTALIYEILKIYKKDTILGGNIRISPLEFLDKIKKTTPVVLELSSWQLEGLAEHKLNPAYAVITNVLVDHLNTYKNMAAYVKTKELIFKFQKPYNFSLLNKDNPATQAMAKKAKSQIFWFTKNILTNNENGCFLSKGWLVFKAGQRKNKIIKVQAIKLQGEHNLENVLAAVTLAMVYKVPLKIIKKAISKFKGLASRLELIREFNGVRYYNDTTATTPDAVIAALNSFPPKVVLLAGGTDKKLVFKDLAKVIKKKVKAIILFEGTATEKLLKELKKIKFNKDLFIVNSMESAFDAARSILAKGDVFLLSPGAASFGLFINEFDRGEQFNRGVKHLKK